MNTKLAELFEKKHYWEVKRNHLYHRILWDYQRSALWFLVIAFQLLTLYLGDNTFKWKGGNKWLSAIWIILWIISLFFWGFTLTRNAFACYYKLPRYCQKICKLDHQIVEELKKLNIQ